MLGLARKYHNYKIHTVLVTLNLVTIKTVITIQKNMILNGNKIIEM